MALQDQDSSHVMIEIEKLAIEEESKRKELNQLKSFLSLDRDHNAKFRADNDSIQDRINQKNQLLLSTSNNCDILELTVESTRSASVLLAITKKLLEKNEPTVDQQLDKMARMKENYKNTLSKYEENPIYKSIIKTGADVERYNNDIKEKQNQIMKMETEREYA